MEELNPLRLSVHSRIDPEILHIKIPAVEVVVHYGVRIVGELQPGTFLVIKGVSLPVPALQGRRLPMRYSIIRTCITSGSGL